MPATLTNLREFKFTATYCLWLSIVLLSMGLQLTDQMTAWRFDRRLISDNHVWLLFSGNIVHLNWVHWGLNMAGLGIVALFFSAYGRMWQWLLVCSLSAIFVGQGLYWWNTDVVTYVGLSGVLHGLFMFGALREVRYYPVSGYVLLVLLAGKLAWEFLYGALPGSEEFTQGKVVTDAHLYGAIGGVVSFVLIAGVAAVFQRK